MKVSFTTPVLYDTPSTCKEKFNNFVEGYFFLSGKQAKILSSKNSIVSFEDSSNSFLLTVLKVISYVTVVFPVVMLMLKACIRCSSNYRTGVENPPLAPDLQSVVSRAPSFTGYKIGVGTAYEGSTLTSATIRPANLFYRALYGGDVTTMPGGSLFQFTIPHLTARARITTAMPDEVISFSASGTAGTLVSRRSGVTPIADLANLYGDATYRMSGLELQQTLESQKIFVSPILPKLFYQHLKAAMIQDGIVILPGNDAYPLKLSQLAHPGLGHAACQALLADVNNHWGNYGFSTQEAWQNLSNLTLYQVGSLVVKREDYRIFMDHDGKILERNPGDQDAIRLLNACGIRGIHHTPPTALSSSFLMKSAFSTAMQAADTGYLVVPAVGMGVWGGDPDLYWNALLESVVSYDGAIEQIFVNPRHQTSRNGTYTGMSGEEFELILQAKKAAYEPDSVEFARLSKITNLYDLETDVVQFSHRLKKAYPNKTVSLLNASDPDVTLGFHVGEYVNNLDHATTTEENYTAMGTNGICFETITDIHSDPNRTVQALHLF